MSYYFSIAALTCIQVLVGAAARLGTGAVCRHERTEMETTVRQTRKYA